MKINLFHLAEVVEYFQSLYTIKQVDILQDYELFKYYHDTKYYTKIYTTYTSITNHRLQTNTVNSAEITAILQHKKDNS